MINYVHIKTCHKKNRYKIKENNAWNSWIKYKPKYKKENAAE